MRRAFRADTARFISRTPKRSAGLNENIDWSLGSVKAYLWQHMEDTKMQLLQHISDQRSEIDVMLASLDEKSIMRDTASTAAITAALTAAEKAIEKSERAVELRGKAQHDTVNAAIAALAKEIEKNEITTQGKLHSGNEFRATLSDQAATFVRRVEVEQIIRQLGDKINVVSDQLGVKTASMMTRNEVDTRINQNSDKIADLGDRLNRMEGKSGGIAATWGVLISVFSIVIVVVETIMLATHSK